jgi:hypothetical protein
VALPTYVPMYFLTFGVKSMDHNSLELLLGLGLFLVFLQIFRWALRNE